MVPMANTSLYFKLNLIDHCHSKAYDYFDCLPRGIIVVPFDEANVYVFEYVFFCVCFHAGKSNLVFLVLRERPTRLCLCIEHRA